MDSTIRVPYKSHAHDHLLLPSIQIVFVKCAGCHLTENMYESYLCNESGCGARFHRKCAEAPLEINNHPSHPQHPLLLTNESKKGKCDFCGQQLESPYYRCCSPCEVNIHLICGIKPLPPTIEHPVCDHDHPLVYSKKRYYEHAPYCEVCRYYIYEALYSCTECNNVSFHVGCVHFPKEANHVFHTNHPLKLIASKDNIGKPCLSCGQQTRYTSYHCSICNFISCLECITNPPPVVVKHIKTHEHPLTCFPRKISFTCDACGTEGDINPYICHQCNFIIHGKCIDLPRLVNINRHDHSISLTHRLGTGYSKCGVCYQSLSPYHGAYFCRVCPNYAAHSQCVVKNKEKVRDGVELEGFPQIIEDIAPFKEMGDNLILHFSHEKHQLRLYNKDNNIPNEWLQCESCLYPVEFDSIYVCEDKCGFVLHEKCANLPKKKRFIFDTAPYMLKDGNKSTIEYCQVCQEVFDGFNYKVQENRTVDVHCCSISEPFVHDGHLHPLYLELFRICKECDKYKMFILHCTLCDYGLCFYCATLPLKIRHKNDKHPLTLCCGEKGSGKYWCDICEEELDPKKWCYTCYDCEVVMHVKCVLGDFSRFKLDKVIEYEGNRFEVVTNNSNSRPSCIQCQSRTIKFSVILKSCEEDNGYICSSSCLYKYGIRK